MVAPRALTPQEEKDVAKRYKGGESSQSLADAFGIHRSTVVTTVRKAGVPLRKAGGSKPRKVVEAPAKAPARKKVAAAAVKAPAKKVAAKPAKKAPAKRARK